MTFIVIAAMGLALAALVLFPVVGLAMVPVVVLAVLALAGWALVLAGRGPGGLPERTTSPREPARPGSGRATSAEE